MTALYGSGMTNGAILVGDVGGTNVRFAAMRDGRVGSRWKRPGADFATFDAALAAFLADQGGSFVGAALGAAGAVRNGQVDLLNRSWSIDAREVAKRVGVRADAVVLVNDFMAMARSAPALGAEEAENLAEGRADPLGSIGVGGPGTGFGVGVLRRLIGVEGYVVVGGEGGHQMFAPLDDLEWALAEALRRRGVYVSNEIVAAGAGFSATLASLAEVMGVSLPPLPETEGAQQAEMIRLAEAGDALGVGFARLRARTVMSALGDLALSANTTGGVFVAGGVAGRLKRWLVEPEALARFYDRGPRTALLADIPIRLIVSDAAPLLGAGLLWLDRQARGWL